MRWTANLLLLALGIHLHLFWLSVRLWVRSLRHQALPGQPVLPSRQSIDEGGFLL